MSNPDWIPRPLDVLIGYTPGMALNPEGKQWHPEDSCGCRDTEDRHWIWRARVGVAARWLNFERAERNCKGRARGLNKARKITRRLIERGELDVSEFEGKDVERAEEALSLCVAFVRDNKAQAKDRLKAADLLLAYTKTKPATKAEVTVKTAEDWLELASGDE